MQGLADGYFIIPSTIGDYIAGSQLPEVTIEHPAFKDAEAEVRGKLEKLLSVKGKKR
jgi:succinate dehydrogenase / fumarate reductase flavoprotein subunit